MWAISDKVDPIKKESLGPALVRCVYCMLSDTRHVKFFISSLLMLLFLWWVMYGGRVPLIRRGIKFLVSVKIRGKGVRCKNVLFIIRASVLVSAI